MNIIELTIGQTIMRSNPDKPPLFGVVVGVDAQGPVSGKPRVWIRTTTGTAMVPVSELDEWRALKG